MQMLRSLTVLSFALLGQAQESDELQYLSLLQSKAQMLMAGNADADALSGRHPLPNLAWWGRIAHGFERRILAKAKIASNKAEPVAAAGAEQAVRLLDFTSATLVYNNLGGQGPITTLSTGPAPQEIRYRNLVQGSAVDLVVTADSGYTAHNPSRNGILVGNGQINAKSGTEAHLTFKFVEEGTNTPYTMSLFYITFSDLDERHGGAEAERIKVSGYDTYYTNDDLAISEGSKTSGTVTFESADYGNYTDNFFHPDSPSPTQLSHAVTFKFTNKANFSAKFSIEEHRDFHAGRNILFSGISQLVFCQEPSVYLDFANATVTTNNLGGKGPGTGASELRWSNIAATDSGQIVDLIAVADETHGYQPWNVSQNGLRGDFGHINLFCGPSQQWNSHFVSKADITFKIVNTGTNDTAVLPQFAFVVFDFDQGLHEQQQEYVEIGPNPRGFDGGVGYASYIVTSTSEVVITNAQSHGKRHFAASTHGTEADNPTTSQNMARETADRSVVFTFRNTGEFKMTLGITATGHDTGRNFMFSGQDMYSMCD